MGRVARWRALRITSSTQGIVDSQSTVLPTPEACLQTNGILRKNPGERCTLIPEWQSLCTSGAGYFGIRYWEDGGQRVQGGKLESR
jgi:hypothetical protein